MGSTRDLLGRVLVVASDHHYDVHPAARCLFKPALNGVSVSCNQCQLAPDGVTIDPLFGLGSPPSFSSAQSKGTEMNFADTAERTAFRAEFRRWIEENLPPEICVDDAASQRVASAHSTLEKRTAWQQKMHAAGWVNVFWPQEYGGRGASFVQQVRRKLFPRSPAPAIHPERIEAVGPDLDPVGNRAARNPTCHRASAPTTSSTSAPLAKG